MMIKKSLLTSMYFFIFLIFVICIFAGGVSAAMCVTAEVSDIVPSSVGINEEFTVGIHIESCGDDIPEIVNFELLNIPTDITVKEPLLLGISKLNYGNSERFITYHMKTTENALPGTHLIKAKLIYGNSGILITENYDITISVIGEKAELGIASLKTDPVLPKAGDTVELTMRIENTGDGIAKSIEVYIDHAFEGIKQSFIGALDSDEDGPAVMTFIVDKPGEYEFPVTISYKDDFGENQIATKIKMSVLEKPSNMGKIIFALVLIFVLGGGIYYFFRVKKSKDRIIHQLLRGNDLKDKGKK